MGGIGTPFIYAAAVIMIMVAAGLIVALVSGNDRKVPQGPIQWMGTVLALLVVISGVWMIILTSGADTVPAPSRGAVAGPDQIEDMDINTPAEDFAFKLVSSGEEARLSDYNGKVVILNMWATWCAPCLYEIPDLNSIHQNYSDSGVVVVSLSDERVGDLKEFSTVTALETISGYVETLDGLPQLVKSGFEIRPTSYVIDRTGTVRKYILGARNYRYFQRTVSEHL
ncbi:MAG: TlpA family protein disulfide reductase [Rhodothermia bacterium]|nr:TlpA family protein disulfide reductase [Rhodothermia bacterium]